MQYNKGTQYKSIVKFVYYTAIGKEIQQGCTTQESGEIYV